MKKTIMIIEDEQSDADKLATIAKSLGEEFTVIVAKNGMEAIEKLKKAEVDLILLDLALPGYISGSNLLFRKEIQKKPVLLVSKSEEIDLKVLKVKFNNIINYLKKPFDEKALKDAISEILNK
jgi:DNA-binding NtrC family response regulator